jgi:hypothetical protein
MNTYLRKNGSGIANIAASITLATILGFNAAGDYVLSRMDNYYASHPWVSRPGAAQSVINTALATDANSNATRSLQQIGCDLDTRMRESSARLPYSAGLAGLAFGNVALSVYSYKRKRE